MFKIVHFLIRINLQHVDVAEDANVDTGGRRMKDVGSHLNGRSAQNIVWYDGIFGSVDESRLDRRVGEIGLKNLHTEATVHADLDFQSERWSSSA